MHDDERNTLGFSLRERLTGLYGDRGLECADRALSLVDEFSDNALTVSKDQQSRWLEPRWSERDVVFITYGNQITSKGESPLATLRHFLLGKNLEQCFSTVHLLPFFPYSSDDGFSVIDYMAVDQKIGTWQDVRRLGERFDLAFDLVLNHVSRDSEWFKSYLTGKEPYNRFFIEADQNEDLSSVTRPRSHPLLTQVKTKQGKRFVWTTFSDDQIDLNFAEPEVLLRMLSVLLEYVRCGARIIRLDAIAYLWKEIGTNCIHQPQTHEVVKLMRDILNAVAPHVLLLTETNVPHEENTSYFGNGDEAQLVYQFSLPPLLLDAFLNGDATTLTEWLEGVVSTPAGTTFLNFTASHDGIGMRPLEGMVESQRFDRLIQATLARGGSINTRRDENGDDVAYELNISYLDAICGPSVEDFVHKAERFLTSQGIMLALRGIPAVYFHSLVGTGNHQVGVEKTGQPRSINRRKFDLSELQSQLDDVDSLSSRIFRGYQQLLAIRIAQPAFHPEAPQRVHRLADSVLAIERTSLDGFQHILSLANLGREPVDVDLKPVAHLNATRNLFTDQEDVSAGRILLFPNQLAWLTNR